MDLLSLKDQEAFEKKIEEIEYTAKQSLHVRPLWRPDRGESGRPEDRHDTPPSVLTKPPMDALPDVTLMILSDNRRKLLDRLDAASAAADRAYRINADVAKQLGIPIAPPSQPQSRRRGWQFWK